MIDPSSNNSGDYITCEGGVAIVLDEANCPESVKQDSASSNQDASENNLMVLFMGGTFAMSAIAMVVVLIRRPTQSPQRLRGHDETDRLFKEQPSIPSAVSFPRLLQAVALLEETANLRKTSLESLMMEKNGSNGLKALTTTISEISDMVVNGRSTRPDGFSQNLESTPTQIL